MNRSRVLNQQSRFFGLGVLDFLFLSAFYMLSQAFLFPFQFEFLGLLLTLALAVLLVPIRLKYRKKFIRDVVFYTFIRLVRKGFIDVQKEL